MKKNVELLAPAGDKDALRGAINAGADAVYLAGKSFGARAYADNFTEEEIMDALGTAHLFGVRIYLTANTLTRQSELSDLVSFVSRLYDAGLDGVIVQDLGVASELRRHCPGLPLHASTQMSITGPDGVRFLKRQGFSRVVPARELSLSEIRELKKTDIEIETFIHGAMCYSYSGRCLMSSFLGGRSGNRGRCAGTCRLPYEILDEGGERISLTEQDRKQRGTAGQDHGSQREQNKDSGCRASYDRNPGNQHSGRQGDTGQIQKAPHQDMQPETYPLSMKDLCVLPILPDLMDAGIDSFKIEGRMKKAEYVAGVTAIYRSYIDRFYEWDTKGRPGRWQIERADLDTLYSLYIRTDLSTGYYHERNGRDMLTIGRPGYRGAEAELLQEIRSRYLDQPPRHPICGAATIQAGRPIVLTVTTADKLPAGTADSQKRREADDGTEEKPAPHGCCKDLSVRVTGPMAELSQKRPLTEENIRSKLTRTGDSPFYFGQLLIDTDGQSFLPVSVLNDLRRRALADLRRAILSSYAHASPAVLPNAANSEENRSADRYPVTTERQIIAAMVMSEGQASAALDAGVDILILDGPIRDVPGRILTKIRDLLPTTHSESESAFLLHDDSTQKSAPSLYAALPHVLRQSDLPWLNQYLQQYRDCFSGFLVRNLEEMEFLREKGYDIAAAADSGLYCWNRSSLDVMKPYCDWFVLPLELCRTEMADTFGNNTDLSRMILPVFGRAPMMITANCVRKTAGKCSGTIRNRLKLPHSEGERANCSSMVHAEGSTWQGESYFVGLRDRTGAIFPVFTDCRHCYNVIYNSVPTSLMQCLSEQDDPFIPHVGGLLLSFTTESEDETSAVLRTCLGAARSREKEDVTPAGRFSHAGNRAMSGQASEFTFGHYRKGAV